MYHQYDHNGHNYQDYQDYQDHQQLQFRNASLVLNRLLHQVESL